MSLMPILLRKFINLVPEPLLIKEGKSILYFLHWHDCVVPLLRPQQRRRMGVVGEAYCKMRRRGRGRLACGRYVFFHWRCNAEEQEQVGIRGEENH